MKSLEKIHSKLLGNRIEAETCISLSEHGWSNQTIVTEAVPLDAQGSSKGFRVLERLPKVEETVLTLFVTDTAKFMQNTPDEIFSRCVNLRYGDFGYDLSSQFNQFILMTPDLLVNHTKSPFNSSAVCYGTPSLRGINRDLRYTYGVLRCDGVWEAMRCQRSSPTSVRGFSLDPAIYADSTIIEILVNSSVERRLALANDLWKSISEIVRSSLVALAKKYQKDHPGLGPLSSTSMLDRVLRAVVVSTLSYHLCVVNTPRRIGLAIAKILDLSDHSDWICDELFRAFVSHVKVHPYDMIWFALMVIEGGDYGLSITELHRTDITNPALPLYYHYTKTVESSMVSREEQTTAWIKSRHNWKPFLHDLIRCGMLTILEEIPLDKEGHEVDWIGGDSWSNTKDIEIEYSEHPRDDYYAVIPEEVYSKIPEGENYTVLEKYGIPFGDETTEVKEGEILVHVKVFYAYQNYYNLRQSTSSGVCIPQLVESTPVVVTSRPVKSEITSEDHEEVETGMSLNSTLREAISLGYYIDLTIPNDPLQAIKCNKSKYALRHYWDERTSVWSTNGA